MASPKLFIGFSCIGDFIKEGNSLRLVGIGARRHLEYIHDDDSVSDTVDASFLFHVTLFFFARLVSVICTIAEVSVREDVVVQHRKLMLLKVNGETV